MEDIILEHAKILIYGTGGNGIGFYERQKNQLHIEGFIDKRADEIKTVYNLPVLTIEDANTKFINKDEYVVFVTIKNVFAHTEIAKTLLNNGFHRIVYKSDNVLKGNEDCVEKRIDEIYETLIEQKGYRHNFSIPFMKSIHISFKDRLCIEKTETEVRTWCPVELLFNYKESNDYPGLNMPLFFPLVELYKLFLGDSSISKEEAIDNFFVYSCEWLKKNGRELNESQKNSFLESRIAVFEEMQEMSEVDIEFFKRNCPEVKLEEKKFYLSSSGRNRVSFLIAKGFKYVPVKMSEKDYLEWCDLQYVNRMENYINDNGIKSFFAPYPNPYLLDFSIDFVDYQRLFLWPIANEIVKKIYKDSRVTEGTLTCTDYSKVERKKNKTSVMCYLQDGGAACQYFKSIGFHINMNEDAEIKYLVVDSCVKDNIEGILNKDYRKVYFLKREDGCLSNEVFLDFGYKRTKKMFETITRKGYLYAEVLEKK